MSPCGSGVGASGSGDFGVGRQTSSLGAGDGASRIGDLDSGRVARQISSFGAARD